MIIKCAPNNSMIIGWGCNFITLNGILGLILWLCDLDTILILVLAPTLSFAFIGCLLFALLTSISECGGKHNEAPPYCCQFGRPAIDDDDDDDSFCASA